MALFNWAKLTISGFICRHKHKQSRNAYKLNIFIMFLDVVYCWVDKLSMGVFKLYQLSTFFQN